MIDPTVFIVSQNDAVRESTRFLLELHCWKVRDFRTPSEFLRNFNPAALGCLVLDQHLPEMTGLQLIEEIRRRGSAMPAILAVAFGNGKLRARLERIGAVAIDPLMPDKLVEAVNNALGSCNKP